MTIEFLQELQEKIEKAKAEKSKAEGALETITESWKKDFGCSTEEEMKALIEKTETQIKDLETKYQTYVDQINELLKDLD